MIITVYAISKNEERFAQRFCDSVKNADHVVVCDTGSTDKTVDIFKANGVEVHSIKVDPWRFDVARNESMKYIPEETDVAIALDIDDVFVEDWRDTIEENWEEGLTSLRYWYNFTWKDDEQTIPNLTILGFKVHDPKVYHWKYPVHEILVLNDRVKQNEKLMDTLLVNHYSGEKEERSQRLELFEMGLLEDPNCERMNFVYAEHLYHEKEYEKSLIVLRKYLDLTKAYNPTDSGDYYKRHMRSKACKMMAMCLLNLEEYGIELVLTWFYRAAAESPGDREPWFNLAKAFKSVDKNIQALAFAEIGLSITDRLCSSVMESWYWDKEWIDKFMKEVKDNIKKSNLV